MISSLTIKSELINLDKTELFYSNLSKDDVIEGLLKTKDNLIKVIEVQQ